MEAVFADLRAALRAVRRWPGCSSRSRPSGRPSAASTGRSPRPAEPSRTPRLRARQFAQPGVVGELAQLRLSLRTSMRATQEALHTGVPGGRLAQRGDGLFERLSAHGHELDDELKRLEREPDRATHRRPPARPARAHRADHALRGLAALGGARPRPQVRRRRPAGAERPDRRGGGGAAPLDPGAEGAGDRLRRAGDGRRRPARRRARGRRAVGPVRPAARTPGARSRGAPASAITARTRAPGRPTRGRSPRGRRARRREAVRRPRHGGVSGRV